MEGITGALFRRTHRRFFPGVDRYSCPFSPQPAPRVHPPGAAGHPAGAGRGPGCGAPAAHPERADFLWAAGELARMGYREVNLNLGCPSGTVTAKGKGAGMLGRPEELDHLLEDIFSASPHCRLCQDPSGYPGPGGVLAHPGHLQQVSHRPAHCPHPGAGGPVPPPRPTGAVPRHPGRQPLPLCYNGDLVTAADCRAFSVRFPGAGLMMGRGWWPTRRWPPRPKGGPGADRDTLRAFHDALYEGLCP